MHVQCFCAAFAACLCHAVPCHAYAGTDSERSSLAAIGSWSRQVKLLSVPDLQPVATEELGSEIIPRSVALADFEGQAYVLCGLGDGQLHNWRLDPAAGVTSGESCERERVCVCV